MLASCNVALQVYVNIIKQTNNSKTYLEINPNCSWESRLSFVFHRSSTKRGISASDGSECMRRPAGTSVDEVY